MSSLFILHIYYIKNFYKNQIKVESEGLEPSTSSLQGKCSPRWATTPKNKEPMQASAPRKTLRFLIQNARYFELGSGRPTHLISPLPFGRDLSLWRNSESPGSYVLTGGSTQIKALLLRGTAGIWTPIVRLTAWSPHRWTTAPNLVSWV